MNIRHVMTTDPIACDVTDAAQDAAGLMRDQGVGCLVVLRNGKVAGIVTDRQLAVSALAEGRPEVPVERIMTKKPVVATLEDDIFTVLDKMRGAGVVRRIPVVNEDEQLVGIVSISDLAIVADRLMGAVIHEERHNALDAVRIPTGGKRLAKALNKPGKEHLAHVEIRAVTKPATRR